MLVVSRKTGRNIDTQRKEIAVLVVSRKQAET